MEYLSAKDAADQWGCTVRWVQQCCKNGTIAGAVKFGKAWIIPQGAPKPAAFRRRTLLRRRKQKKKSGSKMEADGWCRC